MLNDKTAESVRRKLCTSIVRNAGKVAADANVLRDLPQVKSGELNPHWDRVNEFNPHWDRVNELCHELRQAISEALNASR